MRLDFRILLTIVAVHAAVTFFIRPALGQDAGTAGLPSAASAPDAGATDASAGDPAQPSDPVAEPAVAEAPDPGRPPEAPQRAGRSGLHTEQTYIRAPIVLREAEGAVRAPRSGLDEPWISPMVGWLQRDRELFTQLMAPQKPFLERLVDEVRPISGGIISAVLFLLLTLALRLLLRADPVAKRLRGPTNILIAYVVLFALVVLARLLWTDVYQVLYYVSLFVLVLGAIQLVVVALVDVFLSRYRRIETPVILRDIGMIVVYVVTVILVLGKAGVNLTSILTTSAVLTAIIGFALQETLSSIIAGLAIQVEKPFAVGEFVQFQGQTGQVLEINWRTTKILTAHRDVVVIPNNVITREPLINFSAPSSMHRRKLKIGLPYDVPPNRVKESIVTALLDVSGVRSDPAPQALVVEYADFSIVYRIYFFIDAFGDRENLEDRALTRIWYQLRRDGIRIPFPIQDINVRTVGAEEQASQEQVELAQRREALDGVPFLRPLSEAEREALARRVRSVSYGAGESVIHQGDEGDSFYAIAEGQVQVVVASGPGQTSQIVATLGPGQFFGEMSLMTGERRSATIVAACDTRLWVIDRSAFKSLIAANEALVTAIGEVLAERRASLEARREQLRTEDATRLQEDQDTLIKKIRQFFRL